MSETGMEDDMDKDVGLSIWKKKKDYSGNISMMFTKYGFLENKMKPLTM